jgi:ABC-type nitrate/sulfonate/bicarbonate transport system ATPase subunit
MSDRILVFTPRPGRIQLTLDHPLGDVRNRPGLRGTAEFAACRQHIHDILKAQ